MENLNKSCEPMDIDLSARSSSAMDISDNNYSTPEIQNEDFDEDCYTVTPQTPVLKNSPIPSPVRVSSPVRVTSPVRVRSPLSVPNTVPKTETNLKKYHINLKSQPKNTGFQSQLKVLTFLFVVLIAIVVYQCRSQCFDKLNLKNLKENLTIQVFGQDDAIGSIIDALETDKPFKVMFFYGGTGVGKTYISSLIMENLGPSSNVYHYTMPTFVDTLTSNLMLGLIMCDSSIIIIDDLSVDANVSEQINMVINKSKTLEKNTTIILIYNCASTENMYHKKCDESFHSKLLEKYNNADASFFFIKFESLTDVSLRKCIDRELGEVKIDNSTYEKIIKNFNVTSDGCKTVHSKVKVLSMM